MHIGNDVKAEEVSNDEYNKWISSEQWAQWMLHAGWQAAVVAIAAMVAAARSWGDVISSQYAVFCTVCGTSEICHAALSNRIRRRTGINKRVFVR
jgi:hypothetical protein